MQLNLQNISPAYLFGKTVECVEYSGSPPYTYALQITFTDGTVLEVTPQGYDGFFEALITPPDEAARGDSL